MIVKSVKFMTLAAAMMACLLWASPAGAQCTDSLAFGHITGSFITNCEDSAPVDGWATIIGASGTTGTANIICETNTEQPQGGALCQVAAGDNTDKIITISGNWANPGSQGCPPTGNLGRNLYYIRDKLGNGVMLSVGFDPALGLYEAGNADRQADPSAPVVHLGCGLRGSRSLTLITKTPTTAEVQLDPPAVFSDCDTDSVGINANGGNGTGSCDPTTEFAGMTIDPSGLLYLTSDFCSRGANPARFVCNGGNRDGLACTRPNPTTDASPDCPPFNNGCLPKWILGPAPDASGRATVTLPQTVCAGVCIGGTTPGIACLGDASCGGGGTCSDSSAGRPCATSADCGGQCSSGGPRNGTNCVAPTSIAKCSGVCSNDATRNCTASSGCISPGICNARPCTAGTCTPLSAFADMCNYIGTTVSVQGVESGAVASLPIALSGGGQLAPSPRAIDVRATVAGGSIRIQFRTESELNLAGFNILTDAKSKGEFKVNTALIAAEGVGGAGHTYDVLIPHGSFRGGRTVIVESVLTSGGSVRSVPVRY